MKKLLIVFWMLILYGCTHQSDYSYWSYKEDITPLKSLSTSLYDKSQYFVEDNRNMLAAFVNNAIVFLDVATDSLTDCVKLPRAIGAFYQMCIKDRNHFAVYADTSIYIFLNNKFIIKPVKDLNKNIIPVDYYQINYFEKENCIVFAGLGKFREKDHVPYSKEFLFVYDIIEDTSYTLPFKYPEQYRHAKLGTPDIYFTQEGDNLVLSFSYDENIYLINILTKTVKTVKCVSSASRLNVSYAHNNKQEELEAMNSNLYKDSYGKCFWDSKHNCIYRFYTPALPAKFNGRYLTTKEAGCWIIRKDLATGNYSEYVLPRGFFYVPEDWTSGFDENSNIYFTYNKILENAKNRKEWEYYMVNILPYNFR